VECSDCSKFKDIDSSCTGDVLTKPYGVDPVFKRGTTLYNPDFDDVDSEIVASTYNCSELVDEEPRWVSQAFVCVLVVVVVVVVVVRLHVGLLCRCLWCCW